MLKYLLIILIIIIDYANCERTKNKMYTSIIGAGCFRRLNGTHQTGCSSKLSGSEGVLHIISSSDDIDFVLKNPPSPPYIPVLPSYLFTRENILRIKNEGGKNISGIVLINKSENLKSFSNELKCPNKISSLYPQSCDENDYANTWNPDGSGLLHEHFPFPIYYVADTEEIDKIVSCFETFNENNRGNQGGRSVCSIEINTFMVAAVNTEVCIRRTQIFNNLAPIRFCDPLEGKSVFGTLWPRPFVPEMNNIVKRETDKSEKFILISCRLDTTSMFDGVGLGAMDSLISLATLLSVAHTLSQILPEKKDIKQNVLFLVFNGESYDYIGSQRFIYDMNRLGFPTKNTKTNPITLDQIELMIDIGAIDQLNVIDLYIAKSFDQANDFWSKIQKSSDFFKLNVKFSKPEVTMNLPPASAHTFLKANITFPAIILSSKPSNHFMHSIYDDAININYNYGNTTTDFSNLVDQNHASDFFSENSIQLKVHRVSTALASAVYALLSKTEYQDTKVANPILIDEILYCFLMSQDCPLFRAASHPNSLPGLPVPPLRYISVHGGSQDASGWTYRLFGYLLSQKNETIKKENCTILPLHWFAGFNGIGECRITTQNYTYALSPAFEEENYDWASGKYSTWTESTWQPFTARIYLRPSKQHEILTLSVGVIVLILSFVFVYFIQSKSDVLFENSISSASTSQPAAC